MPLNGTDILVQVEDPNTPGTFITLGAQRDATFNETNAEIDESSKDQRHFVGSAGRLEMTVDLDHLITPGAQERTILRDASRNGTLVKLRRLESGTAIESADAIVTSRVETAPDQDAAVISASFKLVTAWA